MSLTTKLYRSREVVLDMLSDRGYNTDEYANYSAEEIDILYKTNNNIKSPNTEINSLDIKVKNAAGNTLVIKYMLATRIRTRNIGEDLEDMITPQKNDYKSGDTIIIVIRDKLKNPEILETQFETIYETKGIFCQLFDIDKLMYNVTKHSMVPAHEVLSADEKADLLKKYNLVSDGQLPLIMKTDPVAKYHGLTTGQVCRIIRSSETHGVYKSYRLCH